MRIWTLFPVALAMLAMPALAADPPATTAAVPHKISFTPSDPPASNPNVSVFFEVRVLKAPAGFCERTGLKLTGNVTLTDTALQQFLTAAQAQRDVNVMQLPKITAFDGQECSVRNCEERSFTTGGEIVRVQGQSVFVPKNKSIELGDVLTVCGHVSADDQAVAVSAKLTRTALVGDVELFPVVTQITPIFEGGSQGKPIPFTQFLQSPDMKTYQIEKNAVVQVGETVVLGGWKETGERPGRKGLLKKEKTAAEYEVVTFATVRVARHEEPAVCVAPMPHESCRPVSYALRNVAAVDAALALREYLRGKKLEAAITAQPVSNTLLVSAEMGVQKQIHDILVGLDKAPQQVVLQATVIEVPRGFAAKWLVGGGPADARSWVLSPREAQMFMEVIRAARGRDECDILSRPQIQLCDNQTGFVRVGQQFPVALPPQTAKDVGAPAGTSQPVVQYVPLGVTLRLTPRVAPDGKSVRLQAEAERTTVRPRGATQPTATRPEGPVSVPELLPPPAFDTQRTNVAENVRAGETLVATLTASPPGGFLSTIRAAVEGTPEMLVVVTPFIVLQEETVLPAGGLPK